MQDITLVCCHLAVLISTCSLSAVIAELTLKVSVNNNAQRHMKGNINYW